jgi:hypothetical protein
MGKFYEQVKSLKKSKKQTIRQLFSADNNLKDVQINLKHQILSFLFMKDKNKENGKTNLEENPNVKYVIEHKVNKIQKHYDLYIQSDILKYKNKVLQKKLKNKQNLKIALYKKDQYGFDSGAEYFIKITVKIKIKNKDYYDKIQKEHLGDFKGFG